MSNGISGIDKITRGITDTAYNLAAKRTKKVKPSEISFSAAASQVQLPQAGPTIHGWGYRSSSTASTNF